MDSEVAKTFWGTCTIHFLVFFSILSHLQELILLLMSPLVLSLTFTGTYSSAHVTSSSIFHIHRNLLFSASIHVSLALTFTGTTLFISLFSSISNIHRNFLYSFQSLAQSLTFAGITSVHFSLLNSHQLFQSPERYVSL